jgi:hypothetical protein
VQVRIAAAVALGLASSAGAQIVQDLATATPVSGTWSYAPTAGGSEARFADAGGMAQLWVHCTHATRRVTIAKAATVAAPFLNIWTSSESRSVASSFSPVTGKLTIDVGAYDRLLDALANSRGRVGFTAGNLPSLVVPPGPEAAHVIEDCRA